LNGNIFDNGTIAMYIVDSSEVYTMTRITQAEKDVVRKAAEEAAALLPKLREDKADLERRIERLESYVRHWDEMSGKRPKEQGEGAAETGDVTKKSRAKKGQVLAHVEAVLNTGGEMDPSDINAAIDLRFGEKYGRSTIYNALAQGEKKNRLVKEGNKWKRNPMLATMSVS
jgi:hypothetical protein